MLGAACAVVGAALVAGAATAATPSDHLGVDSATVSLSTTRAGARPVAVTVRLHTELRCGRLTGSVRLTLPRRARLPIAVRPAAVLVGGRPAASVAVSGHTLTIAPAVPGVICASIAPGTATILLTRSAGVANPPRPGRYAVTVRHRGLTLVAVTRVTA